MKKLAMLLAVLMLAVAAFSVSAFEDVTVNDACFDAVNTLTSLNVIKGKTETTFAPEDPVTREQMAMLFTRLYTTVNFENGENMTPFTDLDDPYFNSAVAWCYDAKVINGTSPTTFEPKAHIIYQDALTMACRLLGYTDLTYPLGNITKARLIGLTDGLEGTAYDKELTRGEVAIILYNALEAEGAEIIKENKVKFYGDYPILEAVERNFEIAVDVYNFKKETYQIVATENFYLAGVASDDLGVDDAYGLIKIEDDKRVGKVETYAFEDIAVAEDTDGDANILAYIEILYRGESLNDKKAVVLSSVINSDLEADAEFGIYFKKETSKDKKETAQEDAILVNGKVFDLKDEDEQIVYTIEGNAIKVVTDLSTVDVFWQTKEDVEAGMYEQKALDVNKDGTPDYVMFFPMQFEKVTGISTKGVYKLESHKDSFDTADEECTLIINADEVKKGDYVLTYEFGPFTVIDSVVEPVITNVSRVFKSSVDGTKLYLANGDVVTFAEKNYPVKGLYKVDAIADPTSTEAAFYIINDKIIFHEAESAAGYEAYSYAFFLKQGETETLVDVEDGGITEVDTIHAFLNGKAVSIPVTGEGYEELTDDDKCVITILDFEDGKYEVAKGIELADALNKEETKGYEKSLKGAKFWFDKNSQRYKLFDGAKTYNINLTSASELYAVTLDEGKFDSVKCYTMANMPKYSIDTILTDAVIAAVRDADDEIVGWNLVLGYIQDVDGLATGTSDAYSDYRIVLSSGKEMDEKKNVYTVYEVLNPVTGALETLVNKTSDSTPHNPGTLVYMTTNGYVEEVDAWDAAYVGTGDHVAAYSDTRKLMQINNILDGEYATVYKGKAQDANFGAPAYGHAQEIKLSDVVIRVIDLDEKGNLEITTTDDVYDLEGKVVRTYVSDGLGYKPAYMVILPWEWAEAAGFENLEAYDDYEA